jgi:hypothetical protein
MMFGFAASSILRRRRGLWPNQLTAIPDPFQNGHRHGAHVGQTHPADVVAEHYCEFDQKLS